MAATVETQKIPTKGQILGCLLGAVLGDIVGGWAKGRSANEARDYVEYFCSSFDFSNAKTNSLGYSFGQITESSQLSRELVLSIIDEKDWSVEQYAKRLVSLFRANKVVGSSETNQKAFGFIETTLEEVNELQDKDNGAAIRAAPIGLVFWDNTDALIKGSVEQASITHKDAIAVSASVAISLAVAMCLNASKETSGPHELGWWHWLARFVARTDKTLSQDIQDLAEQVFHRRKKTQTSSGEDYVERTEVLTWVQERDVFSIDGISSYARSSVLWSLYCLMAYPKDVWEAIKLAVWAGGNTHNMASMAASLVGAHVGVEKFPPEVDQLTPLITDAYDPNYSWKFLQNLVDYFYPLLIRST